MAAWGVGHRTGHLGPAHAAFPEETCVDVGHQRLKLCVSEQKMNLATYVQRGIFFLLSTVAFNESG